MKAEDLRIGNWYVDKFGNEVQASTISKWPDLGMDHDNAKPIPLTEEWLERFGFIDYSGYFQLYLFEPARRYISINPSRNDWGEVCAGTICACQFPAKYVHQLQNLYFALTGEELTLTR